MRVGSLDFFFFLHPRSPLKKNNSRKLAFIRSRKNPVPAPIPALFENSVKSV